MALNELKSKGKSRNKAPKPKAEKPRDVVAFDIGSNTIKVVEGKYSKNRLQVYRMMEAITPEGCIEDGKIINERELSETIKSLISRNGIKIKDAVCTTNSSSIINRDLVIPVVDADEMETVIRYELEQFLPIKLEDYIVQFVVLDKIADTEGAKYKVNVVAYPTLIARSYFDLINSLDMNPYVLDINFNSLSKVSAYSKLVSNGTVAFVDMGANTINVSIFKDGKIDFNRIVKNGGENIDYALSSKLDMSIKTTEAEKIEKGSLIRVDEDDIINTTIQECVDDILGELERILQFYNNQAAGRNIEKIYIFGGSSQIEGLEEYMQKRIGINTKRVRTLNSVEFTNKSGSESVDRYINAIGSIIRL